MTKRAQPEADLNGRLRAALAGMDPVRVENAAGGGEGTPDINYITGWIESKYAKRWPARPTTRLALEHYTEQQRRWHVKRRASHGRVHVILEVGGKGGGVYVLDALDAAQGLGRTMTRDMVRSAALLVMEPWSDHVFRRFIQNCDRDRYEGTR